MSLEKDLFDRIESIVNDFDTVIEHREEHLNLQKEDYMDTADGQTYFVFTTYLERLRNKLRESVKGMSLFVQN